MSIIAYQPEINQFSCKKTIAQNPYPDYKIDRNTIGSPWKKYRLKWAFSILCTFAQKVNH